MKLNTKIKLIRIAERITQTKFATLMGVANDVVVRRIESGKQEPGSYKVQSICNQFPQYTLWLMTDDIDVKQIKPIIRD